jgi:ankyrin repeat protein
MKNPDHRTVLARACSQSLSPEALQVLHDAWPQAVNEAYVAQDGLYPLHDYLGCQHEEKFPQLKAVQLLATPTSMAATAGKYGMTALQIACRQGASPDIVDFLVQQHPEGVRTKSKMDNVLPILFAAAATPPSVEVLSILVAADPESVQVQDPLGRTPLFVCCGPGSSLAAIQFLYRQYPKAIQIPATDESLPLHTACFRGADPEIVQFLYHEYPAAAKEVGNTPIALALMFGKPTKEVVQLFLTNNNGTFAQAIQQQKTKTARTGCTVFAGMRTAHWKPFNT